MNTPSGNLATWPDPADPGSRRSVFADDVVIEGNVISTGPVDVHGRVDGSLRAPEVVVASSGRIDSSVVAHDLSVLGAVSGTISARSVLLAPTAVVRADVMHERIAIEAGALLEGRLLRKG